MQVFNSLGLSASVERNVTVRAKCPIGEYMCKDAVSCSEGGSCANDLSAGVPVDDEDAPTPPAISLITYAALSAYVDVKQHAMYNACPTGVLPSEDFL